MKKIIYTIGWLAFISLLIAVILSFYFQAVYPKDEWDGQLYVLPNMTRTDFIKKIKAFRTKDISLFRDTVYTSCFYTDTTLINGTTLSIGLQETNVFDNRGTLYASIYLNQINGYADFNVLYRNGDVHIVLHGHYLANCYLEHDYLQGDYKDVIRDYYTKNPLSFFGHHNFFSSFEKEFLSHLGEYQRIETQGGLALVNYLLWKSPVPLLLSPLWLFICMYSFIEYIINHGKKTK